MLDVGYRSHVAHMCHGSACRSAQLLQEPRQQERRKHSPITWDGCLSDVYTARPRHVQHMPAADHMTARAGAGIIAMPAEVGGLNVSNAQAFTPSQLSMPAGALCLSPTLLMCVPFMCWLHGKPSNVPGGRRHPVHTQGPPSGCLLHTGWRRMLLLHMASATCRWWW
jgi:hypothetical protein